MCLPIHWQHGAIARLKKRRKKSVVSLLVVMQRFLLAISVFMKQLDWLQVNPIQGEKGRVFAMKIMDRLNAAIDLWHDKHNLGFGLYGTPAESLTNRFSSLDRARFGIIEDITDKGITLIAIT